MPSRAKQHPQCAECAWHRLTAADTLARLGSSPAGLVEAEADRRLAEFGRNILPAGRDVPWWQGLLRQFASPLIAVLALAGALSLVTGHLADAIMIGIVMLANALIGGSQEWRSERSARALRGLLGFRATVRRSGELREIDAAEVVPGDIVLLESGFRVPADVRLLEESGLSADESILTGESVPVEKDGEWTAGAAADTPLADRLNMLHAGTTVVHGVGTAIVVATGASSSVGRLAIDVIGAEPGIPPIVVRLARFARMVGIASLASSGFVAAIGMTMHGHTLAEMAIVGAALAVSLIPEGLPVAVTIALAVAARRMATRGVVVRSLGAVEGLGSCTMIASDKTGTLTCNELTVREAVLPSGVAVHFGGQGYEPSGEVEPPPAELAASDRCALEELVKVAVLCNEADLHRRDGSWVWHGDPTDVALLSMAQKVGTSRTAELRVHPALDRIPFQSERRFSASCHRFEDATLMLVKGAPERVLAMCAEVEAQCPVLPLARDCAGKMAGRGLRVLALAAGAVPVAPRSELPAAAPHALRLLGLVGMIDPLRAGVADAVEACRGAGIATIMVTGDHPLTALAIARELRIARDAEEVLTGDELDRMSDSELAQALSHDAVPREGAATGAPRLRVLARATPAQKLRIVQAAREAGHFVAVTGDGVNDAPALKSANIGIAMGAGGTDAARDASDLILTDDNFATIVSGVEEGRVAYGNVRKVIYLLLSTNGAEAFVIVTAFTIGLPLPLLPSQLLWLNLATEGLQDVALAFEPREPGVLRRAPRSPRESIFDRLMLERLVVGSAVIGLVSLGAYGWMLQAGWSLDEARNTLLLLMVLFENVQALNSRSETRLALSMSPIGNPALVAAIVLSFALHASSMHVPALQGALGTAPVGMGTWLACGALALTLLAAMESHKLWWNRRHSPSVTPGPPRSVRHAWSA